MREDAISGPRLRRDEILPEGRLSGGEMFARGRERGMAVRLQPGPFLTANAVDSELDFKRRMMAGRRLTFHAQIGYRTLDESRRAWEEIHDRLALRGWAPDRYGICLDWSMGFPTADRAERRRGTGLILEREEDYAALASVAPVAPHFGDFVLGMPGAVETTTGALAAGATSIGNLSQYFTFRLHGWEDDVATTRATIEAMGMLAAQPVDILIHSNLDDGYAAWLEDMGSALGFAMIERHIVEEVMGLKLGHCYGHTFSDPIKRLAFGRALARVNPTPGTMIYGNTTLYGGDLAANYGALASYLSIDMVGQITNPTGHALTPIPVTEARRIPSIDEVVEAHAAARRLAERMGPAVALFAPEASDDTGTGLERRARGFYNRVLDALSEAGIDMEDPAELMVALRRIGPLRLEAWFAGDDFVEIAGPGVTSPFVDEIAALADGIIANVGRVERARLLKLRPKVVIAATDVHFYGKRLLETVLRRLGLQPVDGGVNAEPESLARICTENGAGVVAVSTYNGIALSFVQALRAELARHGHQARIYVGGRLNEILDDTGGALPSEVDSEIRQLGARPCATVEEFISDLAAVDGKSDRPEPGPGLPSSAPGSRSVADARIRG